jgi:hypothetical protein
MRKIFLRSVTKAIIWTMWKNDIPIKVLTMELKTTETRDQHIKKEGGSTRYRSMEEQGLLTAQM